MINTKKAGPSGSCHKPLPAIPILKRLNITILTGCRCWPPRAAAVFVLLVLLTAGFGMQSAVAQYNQYLMNPYLPFDMTATATLRASPKKVFAHLFLPFPISIDNEDATNDYYTRGYLLPSGEGGVHLAYGGFLRDRPLTRSVLTNADWQNVDDQTEVSEAIDIGLDGFTLDLFGATNNDPSDTSHYWAAETNLIRAALTVDTNFLIVLMPDMSIIKDTNKLTEIVKDLATYPCTYHLPDGRLVVSPYYPEAQSAAFWQGWLATMSNSYHINIALVPVFQGWQNYAAAYAPFCYGFSDWGDRDAVYQLSPGWTNAAALAHTYVPIWMHPVSAQDERPHDFSYSEAQNSANFRYTWELGAIGGNADWVQIPTWSDYSEASDIEPSIGIQTSFYDLAAYYICWFKNGTPPPIVRDCIYYFHRQQKTSAIPTIQSSTNLFTTDTTPSNSIEAYVFLTADATLQIVNAGVTNQYAVTAPTAVVDVPLQEGRPMFSLIRNSRTVASVQSSFLISNTIPYQDMTYYGGSSLRQPVNQITNGYWPRNMTAPPSAPSELTVECVASSSEIDLTWNATSGAYCYNVLRATNGGDYEQVATVSTAYYDDYNLTPGTTYYYVVSGVSLGGEGDYSSEVSAETDASSDPWTRINDPNSSVAYTGDWSYSGNRGFGDYGNDVHYSTNNGSYVQYNFYGTGIRYIGETYTNEGDVDVYLDGVFQTTLNCYTSTRQAAQVLYAVTNLTLAAHTLKLVNVTTNTMVLDAFDVLWNRINDTNSSIVYTGDWTYGTNRGFGDYNNDVHYATNNGDYAQYDFTGAGVRFVTERFVDEGNVDVYIDGTYKTTVNCLAPTYTRTVQQILYDVDLPYGSHTIKLVKSCGHFMLLDALDVR